MPKAFSNQEKEIIRKKLLEKGKECFEKYGLKKTNVEDLTQAAGISKGAFYLFYRSKEELFLEILEGFEAQFREELFSHVLNPGMPARENFRELLKKAFLTWESSVMLKNFSQEEFEYLVRKLPPEKVEQHILNDDAFVAQFIQKWQEQGLSLSADPKTVSGLLKALFFVSLHKDDLGKDAYPGTMELLIDLITAYLVPER